MSQRIGIERVVAMIAVAVALGATPFSSATSQQVDSTRAGARPPARAERRQPADTTPKPPISPKRAFLYSLLVPGYGQSVLDRPIAGALFFGAEVTWVALATKSAFDLRFARAHERDSIVATYKIDSLGNPVPATFVPNRYGPERVSARRKHLEDYYALLIANHLLAGAEAFVAAQLWDLPGQVSIKALPFGAVVAASIRW